MDDNKVRRVVYNWYSELCGNGTCISGSTYHDNGKQGAVERIEIFTLAQGELREGSIIYDDDEGLMVLGRKEIHMSLSKYNGLLISAQKVATAHIELLVEELDAINDRKEVSTNST